MVAMRKRLSEIICDEYRFAHRDEPEWGIIGPAINADNQMQAGGDHAQSLCFVLSDPGQETVGGVIGSTYWDRLPLDLLWVNEELRDRGYGHRLLTLAEDEAARRGAKNACLDTFSFQAPDFYKRLSGLRGTAGFPSRSQPSLPCQTAPGEVQRWEECRRNTNGLAARAASAGMSPADPDRAEWPHPTGDTRRATNQPWHLNVRISSLSSPTIGDGVILAAMAIPS